jgi:conjugal transfer pilus assembly protein TraD
VNSDNKLFAFGDHAELFNCDKGGIQFDEVLGQRLICYFQLPTMLYPFLGEATGKLVLQCFQSAVARRQVGLNGDLRFFSCYLDDFQDYIYRGFGSLLNKSRSANVGIVFSHQALGDLDKVSEDFRNVVLTNTNIKIVMRNNDPVTCEYFAKSFGTERGEKTTDRRKSSPLGETRTGDGSVREVEQYVYHPNEIRRLGTGEAVVAIPHPRGVKMEKIQFARRPDIPAIPLPCVPKEIPNASTEVIPPGNSERQSSRA